MLTIRRMAFGLAAALAVLNCQPALAQAATPAGQQVAPGGAETDARRINLVDGVTTFETTMRFDNHDRRILWLRPIADNPQRVPAIMLLHYRNGSAEQMVNLTDISRLVRDNGIWVILPEALRGRWSTNPTLDRRRTDDSTFLAQVIDHAVATYPLDSRRIYVAGFSLGGFMTERFVCDHSERIAAVAWSSATLLNSLRAACPLSNPTPVMQFHGTADRRVKYDGKFGLASAPETAAFFAGRNACGAPVGSNLPDIADDRTTVHLDAYNSCSSAEPVRFYTIDGGGHTWPGNHYQGFLLGPSTEDIDATLLMWDFFRGFSR